ncbi:MAG TPA: glycosyltransferase [Candidatus Limnocylindrales bacterium]|nr:glycosyltransferase [Candidatus Limnocylindrales bacterium]
MRVVMYVHNDVSQDARVLREASSLAQAGHSVTIVGRGDEPGESIGAGAQHRVAIVRVQPAGGHSMARAPWRAIRMVLRTAHAKLDVGPAEWPSATLDLVRAIVLVPYAVVRGAWVLLVNRWLRRPVNLHLVDFLHRWRVDVADWAHAAVDAAPTAEVHHAHDLEALPAALRAADRDRSAVVYDKHEIFTGKRWLLAESPITRWLVERWERRSMHRVDGLVTVNQAIADRLARQLHPSRLVVVYNCPARYDPPATPVDHLRAAAGIAHGTPVALYHGGFTRDRGLVELVAAIREPGLEAVHAVFLGEGPLADELKALATSPTADGRVHVLPAVPPEVLLDWITTADVAVMALQPWSLNHWLSTPNKLFEAIAAGVPVVSSDFPERRRIVADRSGPLGVLVDPTDPAAIAAGIRQLLEAAPAERAALRARCLAAAHERWNWEIESAKLVELYAELAARRE